MTNSETSAASEEANAFSKRRGSNKKQTRLHRKVVKKMTMQREGRRPKKASTSTNHSQEHDELDDLIRSKLKEIIRLFNSFEEMNKDESFYFGTTKVYFTGPYVILKRAVTQTKFSSKSHLFYDTSDTSDAQGTSSCDISEDENVDKSKEPFKTRKDRDESDKSFMSYESDAASLDPEIQDEPLTSKDKLDPLLDQVSDTARTRIATRILEEYVEDILRLKKSLRPEQPNYENNWIYMVDCCYVAQKTLGCLYNGPLLYPCLQLLQDATSQTLENFVCCDIKFKKLRRYILNLMKLIPQLQNHLTDRKRHNEEISIANKMGYIKDIGATAMEEPIDPKLTEFTFDQMNMSKELHY